MAKSNKNPNFKNSSSMSGMTSGTTGAFTNSTAIDQAELQNARSDMNTNQYSSSNSMSGMTSGSTGAFTNSSGINQSEIEYAKRKVKESGMQNNTLS